MEDTQKDRIENETGKDEAEAVEPELVESDPLKIPVEENDEDILPLKSNRPQSPSPMPPEKSNRRGHKRKIRSKEKGGMGASQPSSIVVVREVYDSVHAPELFERELEWALEAEAPAIVVEPARLGDETARWITVGNCLHKGGVIAGAACLLAGTIWPNRPVLYIPTGVCSALCTSLYMFSWSTDPCCKYQVETDSRQLSNILPLHLLSVSPKPPPGWIGRPEGPPSSSSSTSSSSSQHYQLSASPVVLVRKDDTRRKVLHSTVTVFAVLLCAYRLYYMRK